ncbi:MAG: SprT family zinc-dependent metalloprotease [Pseudomonadota bacterium]
MVDDDYEMALNGRFYPIRIKRSSRARSVIVSADTVKEEVRLTVPRYTSMAFAIRFAQSKTEWLAERFAEAPPVVPIVNGTQIALFGETRTIHWSPNFARRPRLVGDEIQVGGPEDRMADRIIAWLRDQARETCARDLAEYCARATLPVPRLSIGDARRRWGSCSGRKSIRLSWRLVMAPEMVRRSVVAHEVAHLEHMNHGPEFYHLLDRIFEGDRKNADAWLKRHGGNLHLIGA